MTDIKTVKIKGKEYVEVAERVRLVHDQQRPFELIESEPYAVADRTLWRVTILVDEKKYKGNAEVKLNAPKNTPDGTNPFECAETSALGRALAFAGFGTVESIASADEVARALLSQQGNVETTQQQTPRPVPMRATTAPTTINSNVNTKQTTQKPEPASKELVAQAEKMFQDLGRDVPADLAQKSAKVIRTYMEQMAGVHREKINTKNGHSISEDIPNVKSLRERCAQLGLKWEVVQVTAIKTNILDDSHTSEQRERINRFLNNVAEQQAKRAQQPEQAAS